MSRAVTLDPTVRARFIVACGTDVGLRAMLEGHGDVTDLPLGVEVPAEAWSRIDLLVVHLNDALNSPTAGLTSPARTGALMTLLTNLRAAGSHGVERIVIEDGTSTQPHTGVLADECDLYVSPSGALGAADALSVAAREVVAFTARRR